MMPVLPSQSYSPIGQLAPDQQGNMPQINPSLLDAFKRFMEAQMMANGAAPNANPQQQPQPMPQAPPSNQNPGMGGLSFPNMNPQNTGLTPQFGSQIGGALKGLMR